MTGSAVHLGLENTYKVVIITQFLISEQNHFQKPPLLPEMTLTHTLRLAAFQIVQYVNTTHTRNIFAEGKCDLLTIKGKDRKGTFYLSLYSRVPSETLQFCLQR